MTPPPHELLDDFRRHLSTLRLPAGRALVAVSGGPDSVALLDLLHRTPRLHRLDLVVAHFDHGIHPASARVAEAVRALAASYRLAYEEGRGDARARRPARRSPARPAMPGSRPPVSGWARRSSSPPTTQTIRSRPCSCGRCAGSGPAGLAGMARAPGQPWSARCCRSGATRSSGTSARRPWPSGVDPANQDPRHLRAWLRGDVLPLLRTRLPPVDAALLAVGRQAARDRAAWNAVLDLLPGLDFRLERDGFSVAARPLSGYDSALGETV